MMMIWKYNTVNYPPLLTNIIWTLYPSFDATPIRRIAELTITLFYTPRLIIILILIIVLQIFWIGTTTRVSPI